MAITRDLDRLSGTTAVPKAIPTYPKKPTPKPAPRKPAPRRTVEPGDGGPGSGPIQKPRVISNPPVTVPPKTPPKTTTKPPVKPSTAPAPVKKPTAPAPKPVSKPVSRPAPAPTNRPSGTARPTPSPQQPARPTQAPIVPFPQQQQPQVPQQPQQPYIPPRPARPARPATPDVPVYAPAPTQKVLPATTKSALDLFSQAQVPEALDAGFYGPTSRAQVKDTRGPSGKIATKAAAPDAHDSEELARQSPVVAPGYDPANAVKLNKGAALEMTGDILKRAAESGNAYRSTLADAQQKFVQAVSEKGKVIPFQSGVSPEAAGQLKQQEYQGPAHLGDLEGVDPQDVINKGIAAERAAVFSQTPEGLMYLLGEANGGEATAYDAALADIYGHQKFDKLEELYGDTGQDLNERFQGSATVGDLARYGIDREAFMYDDYEEVPSPIDVIPGDPGDPGDPGHPGSGTPPGGGAGGGTGGGAPTAPQQYANAPRTRDGKVILPQVGNKMDQHQAAQRIGGQSLLSNLLRVNLLTQNRMADYKAAGVDMIVNVGAPINDPMVLNVDGQRAAHQAADAAVEAMLQGKRVMVNGGGLTTGLILARLGWQPREALDYMASRGAGLQDPNLQRLVLNDTYGQSLGHQSPYAGGPTGPITGGFYGNAGHYNAPGSTTSTGNTVVDPPGTGAGAKANIAPNPYAPQGYTVKPVQQAWGGKNPMTVPAGKVPTYSNGQVFMTDALRPAPTPDGWKPVDFQWASATGPDRIQVVNVQGVPMYQFKVAKNGDPMNLPSGAPRSEFDSVDPEAQRMGVSPQKSMMIGPNSGQKYYKWTMNLPTDFYEGLRWATVMQWHVQNKGNMSGNSGSLSIHGGFLDFGFPQEHGSNEVLFRIPLSQIKGKNIDIGIDIKWHPTNGHVQWYMNGQPVGRRYEGPTATDLIYLKQGLYTDKPTHPGGDLTLYNTPMMESSVPPTNWRGQSQMPTQPGGPFGNPGPDPFGQQPNPPPAPPPQAPTAPPPPPPAPPPPPQAAPQQRAPTQPRAIPPMPPLPQAPVGGYDAWDPRRRRFD